MRVAVCLCALLLAMLVGTSPAQDLTPARALELLPPVASPPPTADGRILPVSFYQPAPSNEPCIGLPPPPPISPGDALEPCCPCDPCSQCRCAPCTCPEQPAACLPCPRINLINPSWQLLLTGWLELDMLFNSARPVAPGVPFFLAPGSPVGNSQATFDAHARQTTLFAAFVGPQIGNFKAGGLFAAALFNDAVIADRYGVLPFQAYGDLTNEDWRFAAGLQIDIFAPLFPTVLPFSYLIASGNVGAFRGQLRGERFLHPSDDSQITLTAGLSDPRSTTYTNQILSEDAGWPNIEMRAAWAVGPESQEGLIKKRPFEVGVSTVVGQLRTVFGFNAVIADVWGLAGDLRWRIGERFGLAAEIFTGQGLGTYGAAVLQPVNTVTGQSIHATGGWLELYYYLTECLHSHTGLGIDDPVDSELAATQIAFNRTIFTNLIWDVTRSLRLAGEIAVRKTNYVTFPDNDGVGFQAQAQWRF
jgi:hypothetical protein